MIQQWIKQGLASHTAAIIESTTMTISDTTVQVYNPDYPIHLKDPVMLLADTVEKINNQDNLTVEELSTVIIDTNVGLHHGISQIQSKGYITEAMANGEPAPDWVPIKKQDAIREAMEFLKNDPNLNPPKVDKRNKSAFTEEEWEEKTKTRKEKNEEKKRKLAEFDSVSEERDRYKELYELFLGKYKKYKAKFAEKHNQVVEE